MFNIPVSNGELVDKYTILLIKQDKISDCDKLEKINLELQLLEKYIESLNSNYNIITYISNLKQINYKLWNIEDKIRIKEKNKLFDKEFIDLARSIYFTNDERSSIKLKINNITNSKIIEVKSYENYQG